jgi:NAD(P)-dependent dehydrogenase (short-subunit alcohol dehydrogenase family)
MSTQSAFRHGLFDGKVALITGGGTGIGFAIAQGVIDHTLKTHR